MATNSAAAIQRVNIFKAIVPLVPIVLLMFVKPNKHVHWPGINEQESIAAAMLVGVVARHSLRCGNSAASRPRFLRVRDSPTPTSFPSSSPQRCSPNRSKPTA